MQEPEGVAVTVELRGEGDARLRGIVREGLPRLVRALAERDLALPSHVEREFAAYLGCGDPAEGFAWLECEDCGHHRLVLFSCKTRGFCPSCAGRRMAERAMHLVDRVIPHVATRQWVLTVPWRRRWLLARRSDLADGVLRVALREIGRWYRQTTGRAGGRSGSVTAIQRFGSALNLNLHFHIVHLDGVFDRGADEALRFFEAPPTTEDVEALVVEVGLACERWLARQGFAGEAEDSEEAAEDGQAILQLASVSGRVATGERAGGRARRVTRLGGKEVELGPRCAVYEGYNLHANVSLGARERGALERLCRYILRPPLAVKRLERLPDGRVRLGMKRIWSDGTAAVEFSAQEFTERLAALVPPPRANQVLYGGVLAGNAAWRAEVVPKVATSDEARATARAELRLVRRAAKRARNAGDEAPCWAELLKRVFGVDGWKCPGCEKRMTLRTIVVGAPASTRIVTGLLRARAPPGVDTPGAGRVA